MGGRIVNLKLSDLTEKDIARFWSKVEKTEKCRIWKSYSFSDGYGVFSLRHIYYRATAISYLIHNKTLNSNLFRLHTCDNPLCVNPTHLWEGTQKENIQDMMQKGRGKNQFDENTPTVFKKGHIPASRKISKNKAKSIKTDLKSMRQCDVIRKYKVSRDTIRGIVRGTAWGSI